MEAFCTNFLSLLSLAAQSRRADMNNQLILVVGAVDLAFLGVILRAAIEATVRPLPPCAWVWVWRRGKWATRPLLAYIRPNRSTNVACGYGSFEPMHAIQNMAAKKLCNVRMATSPLRSRPRPR